MTDDFTWAMRSGKHQNGMSGCRLGAARGIAREHCRAPTFADTDWRRIAEMYDRLDRIAPSPLHSLNRAVAEANLHGPQGGLERLAAVGPESVPARHPSWHSAAERAWREALCFTTARADRE